jgi:hypothetical protein
MLTTKKQCQGKNCYDKKGVITALNYQREDKGIVGLKYYHCDICNWWHLTSHKMKHGFYDH